MEDKDFWRLTGIERDVFLQAYPKLTIWDFFLKSSLDSTYKNGIFNATVDLREFTGNNVKKGTLKLELLDKTGLTGSNCKLLVFIIPKCDDTIIKRWLFSIPFGYILNDARKS